MKKNTFILFSFCIHIIGVSQTNIKNIIKIEDGFYQMYYDTSSIKKTVSKSGIVEFKNYLVLLEMPIAYSNSNLSDHKEDGEKVLKAIGEYFPGKPLKYIISSHWHPHSISSVLPFISKGITLITTKNNFQKIKSILDSNIIVKYQKQFLFVDTDSLVIEDKINKLVIYKCYKKDYAYIPTEDFLFTYLPKYKILQTSCMYQRLSGSNIYGKEMVSGRVENLVNFTQKQNLKPLHYLCTEVNEDDNSKMVCNDTLQRLMNKGIGMIYMENEILKINVETLNTKADSLLKEFVNAPVSNYVINKAVYTCLQKNNLNKALALAKIQALKVPSDPNVWDTLGEVYFFLGDSKMAKRYEAQSEKIDKNFKHGGEQNWKKDLESFKKYW